MGEMRILVIDDEMLIVKSTCILLRHRGFRTLEAYDGGAGLEIARSALPDLILLDLIMPGMDGWRVLERLREDPATSGIPVIIFTAKEYANAEAVSTLRGARGHIRKPFEPEELEEVIRGIEDAEPRRADT